MKQARCLFQKSLLTITLSLCLIFSGCNVFSPEKKDPNSPPLTTPAKASYVTEKVVYDQLNVSEGGFVDISSGQSHALSFTKRGGYLKMLTIPTLVSKGDIIAKLDTTSLETEIKNAEMDLDSAKISLDKILGDNSDTYDIDLKIVHTKIEQLEEKYQSEKNRLGSILTTEDKLLLNAVELEIEKAKIEYESLSNKNTSKNPDIEMAEIRVKQAEQKLSHLRRELNECILTAPCDGKIIEWENNIMLGSYVNANQTICVIADTTQLSLTVPLNFTASSNEQLSKLIDKDTFLSGQVYVGQNFEKSYKARILPPIDPITKEIASYLPYQLILDEFPEGIKYENGCYSIDLSVTDETGTPIAHYLVDGSSQGFFFSFPVFQSYDKVLQIPLDAVHFIEDGTGKTAIVSVLENGIKVDKTVTIGYCGQFVVEVTGGLREGDEVIISEFTKK